MVAGTSRVAEIERGPSAVFHHKGTEYVAGYDDDSEKKLTALR